MKKKTLEEINEIYHKKYPYIDVLKFDGYGKYAEFLCNKCNNQWTRNFGINNCPECSKKEKKILYKNKYGNKYTEYLLDKNIEILEEYVDNSTKIKHRCKICGHKWNATPSNVKSCTGKICPKCSGVYQMTHEEFLNELENKYPGQFVLINEFTGLCNDIKAKCLRCNSDIDKTAHSLLENGCRKCNSIEYNSNQFYDKLNNLFNGDIIPLSNYVKASENMDFYKKSCGHYFSTTPNHLFNRQNCPKCNKSIGEQKIENLLIKYNIKYEDQKTFNDLRGINNGLLPYDFYLPKYNLIIEFQGEQHEHPIECFGGKEKFKVQQKHDKMKREYSKLHKINLLEIWYYDINNIENILIKELNLKDLAY